MRLPCHRRVCRLCDASTLGDERHMLHECPADADLRGKFCAGHSSSQTAQVHVMAGFLSAKDQLMGIRYIIACPDRMSC